MFVLHIAVPRQANITTYRLSIGWLSATSRRKYLTVSLAYTLSQTKQPVSLVERFTFDPGQMVCVDQNVEHDLQCYTFMPIIIAFTTTPSQLNHPPSSISFRNYFTTHLLFHIIKQPWKQNSSTTIVSNGFWNLSPLNSHSYQSNSKISTFRSFLNSFWINLNLNINLVQQAVTNLSLQLTMS